MIPSERQPLTATYWCDGVTTERVTDYLFPTLEWTAKQAVKVPALLVCASTLGTPLIFKDRN